MHGIDAKTGKRLSGLDHLRQSITDILTTPLGSRVMRREYGSRLFYLIDAPMNRGTLLELYAATAEALAKWEPRLRLEQVRAASAEPGRVILDLTGLYVPAGRVITLDGIEVT
jgi:phage baseplate assembly protein W